MKSICWRAGWVLWALLTGWWRQEAKHRGLRENKDPFSLLFWSTARQPALIKKMIFPPVLPVFLWALAQGTLSWRTMTLWTVSRRQIAFKYSSQKKDVTESVEHHLRTSDKRSHESKWKSYVNWFTKKKGRGPRTEPWGTPVTNDKGQGCEQGKCEAWDSQVIGENY